MRVPISSSKWTPTVQPRINSGKLQLLREQVNPAEVVLNALTALQKEISDRQIRIESAEETKARLERDADDKN